MTQMYVQGWLRLFVVCASLHAHESAAQTVGNSTGSIEGTITDPAGNLVSGVRVCASGPMLMAARCVDSASDGGFRLHALSPGQYMLTLAVPGFDDVQRQEIEVRLSETATVMLALSVTRPRIVVNVERSAPVLDRRSTTIGAWFSAETLSSLPGPRTMGGILAAAPGIMFSRQDVGGNTAFAGGPPAAYGIAGFNRPTLEGISVANINTFGLTLDYGSFDEVWVGLGGFGPEWPSPGIHTSIVTKSGGNQYRGSVYAGVETERWQGRNIDDEQIARGAAGGAGVSPSDANRLHAYHDLNADIGGFIRRDRVWWYASVRDHGNALRRVTFPSEPIETRGRNATAKATIRTGRGNRIVMFAQRSRTEQPIRLDGFLLSAETALHQSAESTSELTATGLVWKAEWTGEAKGTVFFEAFGGQFVGERHEHANGATAIPRREDRGSFAVSGGNREWRDELRRDQLTASMHYGGGAHFMKVGGEVLRTIAAESWIGGYDGDVLHVLRNGRPQEIYLLQTPSRSESGQWWFQSFANDTWRVTNQLTLNLGLRFDRFQLFLPAQARPAGRFSTAQSTFAAVGNLIDWNVLSPRLGVSLALDGDGRTILKSSYGLYSLPPGTDLGFNANANARTSFARHAWSDNGTVNGVWDPGEEGVLLEQRGGSAIDRLDPGLHLPRVHEATARVEREAGANFTVRTGVVWRGERQQGARAQASYPFDAFSVATAVPDPGADDVAGTADDGDEIVLHDLAAGVTGLQPTVIRNVAYGESDYLTWEVAADRRTGEGWSLSASFAQTWHQDHASAYLGQQVRNNEFPLTPNDLINTGEAGRHVFSLWSAKVSGTYEMPWQIRVTPFVRYQSGQSFARTFQTQLPNYGLVRVLAEPVGTRRQDNLTILDVHVERAFPVHTKRLTAFVEGFNMLNTNAEQNVNWSSGSMFLRPLSVIPPRIVRLGLRMDW